MIFIGVDPSLTNTGVVCLSAEGALLSTGNSKEALNSWRNQSKEERNSPRSQAARLLKIRDYVLATVQTALLKQYCEEAELLIYYEDYSFDSLNRAYSLGELGGVLKSALTHTHLGNCRLYLAPPTTVKKFAVNRGDCAEKDPIMARAQEECPALQKIQKKYMTSDLCDAYFLAKMAWYKGAPEMVIQHETHKDLLRSRLEIVKD